MVVKGIIKFRFFLSLDICVELGLLYFINVIYEKKMEIVSYINVFFMDLVVMKLILEYYEVFLGLGKYKFIKVKLIVNEDIYFVVYK